MSRFRAYLLVVVLLLFFVFVPSALAILNGGFESGLSGWTVVDGEFGTISPGYGSANALEVLGTANCSGGVFGGNCNVLRNNEVVPTGVHTLTFYIRPGQSAQNGRISLWASGPTLLAEFDLDSANPGCTPATSPWLYCSWSPTTSVSSFLHVTTDNGPFDTHLWVDNIILSTSPLPTSTPTVTPTHTPTPTPTITPTPGVSWGTCVYNEGLPNEVEYSANILDNWSFESGLSGWYFLNPDTNPSHVVDSGAFDGSGSLLDFNESHSRYRLCQDVFLGSGVPDGLVWVGHVDEISCSPADGNCPFRSFGARLGSYPSARVSPDMSDCDLVGDAFGGYFYDCDYQSLSADWSLFPGGGAAFCIDVSPSLGVSRGGSRRLDAVGLLPGYSDGSGGWVLSCPDDESFFHTPTPPAVTPTPIPTSAFLTPTPGGDFWLTPPAVGVTPQPTACIGWGDTELPGVGTLEGVELCLEPYLVDTASLDASLPSWFSIGTIAGVLFAAVIAFGLVGFVRSR